MAKRTKTVVASTQYVDDCSGATADSVYVTDPNGEEIASLRGCDWNDETVSRLEKAHGPIRATFQGGTLDGFEAL
ncbi:MAG: hypothetical protein HQL38_03155 [Alphaproteobacteria bacterium]|nr:hypothetical protein [Alphaproteobacteria bacterium]